MNNNFESLMRDVARAVQGDARRRQLLPEIQSRLAALDEQSRQSQRAHGTWRLSLLGAAACAAGIAFFVMRPQPLSYRRRRRAAPVIRVRSASVSSRSASAPLSLRFSDGSQVTLPPHAQAHVDALDAQGATVALEEGTVEVSVVHRSHTRWSIRAGRYQIRVTGTQFSAGWDSAHGALTVTMREGSVEVTGPGMKAPARVVSGQRLRANGVTAEHAGDPPEVVVEDATTVAARPPVEAEAPAASPEAAAPEQAPAVAEAPADTIIDKPVSALSRKNARDDRRAPHARRAAPAAAQTRLALADAEWRALEARGRMKEALAAAVHEGDWTTSCRAARRRGSRQDGRHRARARAGLTCADVAYQTARQRFPSADRADLRPGQARIRPEARTTSRRATRSRPT